MFDMERCVFGDKLVLRNGDVVTYKGLTGSEVCQHLLTLKSDRTTSVTKGGCSLASGMLTEYDVVDTMRNGPEI